MTHQNLILTEEAIKGHCKRLKKELKNYNHELSLGEIQNLFSKALGFNNFHELKKVLNNENVSLKKQKKRYLKECEITEQEKLFLDSKYLQLFLLSINGNLDKFKEYINNHTDLDLNFVITGRSWEPKSIIEFALKSNNLEIVNYLIDNKDLNINLHISNDYLLRHACIGGYLYLVKKLFKIINFDYYAINVSFYLAAQYGHLDIIRFFIKETNVNIHFSGNYALKRACFSGNLEVVKFLLTSPELKEHANIFAEDIIEASNVSSFKTGQDIRDMFIWEFGSRPEHRHWDNGRTKIFEIFDFLINDYNNSKIRDWFKEKPELERYIC